MSYIIASKDSDGYSDLCSKENFFAIDIVGGVLGTFTTSGEKCNFLPFFFSDGSTTINVFSQNFQLVILIICNYIGDKGVSDHNNVKIILTFVAMFLEQAINANWNCVMVSRVNSHAKC